MITEINITTVQAYNAKQTQAIKKFYNRNYTEKKTGFVLEITHGHLFVSATLHKSKKAAQKFSEERLQKGF
jgi:hypothetical protein